MCAWRRSSNYNYVDDSLYFKELIPVTLQVYLVIKKFVCLNYFRKTRVLLLLQPLQA